MATCADCDAELPTRSGPGRRRLRCFSCAALVKSGRELSSACLDCSGPCNRQASRCKICHLARARKAAQPGLAAYRARRRIDAPMPQCADCGILLASRRAQRCNSCNMVKRNREKYGDGIEAATNRRRRYAARRARDNAAPGPYKKKARERLLREWKAQGRVCAYCLTHPVETIDHVIPLARGGTNFEGNLAPACSPCNTAKWDNLLSAWRYGIGSRRPPTSWAQAS